MGKKADATKQRILQCALELFDKKGFYQVTIEEITRRAGVAKGTFYTYFRTKSDVIVEEFWQIDAYYDAVASSHLKGLTSVEEKLEAFIRAQMIYIQEEVGYRKLKVLYANQVAEDAALKMITNTHRRWHTIIRDILYEGQQSAQVRSDLSADTLTILVNRCIRGVFLDWCVRDGGFDLIEEGLGMLRNIILPALKRPQCSPPVP